MNLRHQTIIDDDSMGDNPYTRWRRSTIGDNARQFGDNINSVQGICGDTIDGHQTKEDIMTVEKPPISFDDIVRKYSKLHTNQQRSRSALTHEPDNRYRGRQTGGGHMEYYAYTNDHLIDQPQSSDRIRDGAARIGQAESHAKWRSASKAGDSTGLLPSQFKLHIPGMPKGYVKYNSRPWIKDLAKLTESSKGNRLAISTLGQRSSLQSSSKQSPDKLEASREVSTKNQSQMRVLNLLPADNDSRIFMSGSNLDKYCYLLDNPGMSKLRLGHRDRIDMKSTDQIVCHGRATSDMPAVNDQIRDPQRPSDLIYYPRNDRVSQLKLKSSPMRKYLNDDGIKKSRDELMAELTKVTGERDSLALQNTEINNKYKELLKNKTPDSSPIQIIGCDSPILADDMAIVNYIPDRKSDFTSKFRNVQTAEEYLRSDFYKQQCQKINDLEIDNAALRGKVVSLETALKKSNQQVSVYKQKYRGIQKMSMEIKQTQFLQLTGRLDLNDSCSTIKARGTGQSSMPTSTKLNELDIVDHPNRDQNIRNGRFDIAGVSFEDAISRSVTSSISLKESVALEKGINLPKKIPIEFSQRDYSDSHIISTDMIVNRLSSRFLADVN